MTHFLANGAGMRLSLNSYSMSDFNCMIFVFESTHQALAGEKALKEAGIRHAVINTPREFSSNCGISLRVEPELGEQVQSFFQERGIHYASVEPYRSRWMKE